MTHASSCPAPLPFGWSQQGMRISREFLFSDFLAAMRFMQQVAAVCEEMNHHPEWRNIYNRVWVELTTHDTGTITEKDLLLAEAMNQIFTSMNQGTNT